MAGHVTEFVAVSWIANPCGRSSRCTSFRTPPDFGAVWAAPAPGDEIATTRTSTRTSRVFTRRLRHARCQRAYCTRRRLEGRRDETATRVAPHGTMGAFDGRAPVVLA